MTSVVIPCYNGAALIRRCLDSVLSQTLKPCEVIVVNNGSTDNSGQIITSYGVAVKYVEQSNAGPGATRNTGLGLATGKYVAFLDADDYWLPEFLEKCVAFLEAHPEAIAVSTGQRIKTWGHRAVTWPAILANGPDGSPRVLESFFGFWAQHNHITTGSNVIRRDVERRQSRRIQISPENLKAFEENVRRVRSRGRKMVLLYIPTLDVLNQADSEHFQEVMRRFEEYAARDEGVIFLNYNRDLQSRHELFFDSMHMNPAGQPVATDRLPGDLRAMLSGGPVQVAGSPAAGGR